VLRVFGRYFAGDHGAVLVRNITELDVKLAAVFAEFRGAVPDFNYFAFFLAAVPV
jgi:hypothetical protein